MFEVHIFLLNEGSSFLTLRFENDVNMYGTQTLAWVLRHRYVVICAVGTGAAFLAVEVTFFHVLMAVPAPMCVGTLEVILPWFLPCTSRL